MLSAAMGAFTFMPGVCATFVLTGSKFFSVVGFSLFKGIG